jgi:hypothetical protein
LHTYLLKKKKKVRLDSENFIWTKKKGDEGKNDSSTQVKEGERIKDSKFHNTFLCVECNICELSIYRKNSQLIYEKLWDQVTHKLDLVQKYLKFSPKYIILSKKKNIF